MYSKQFDKAKHGYIARGPESLRIPRDSSIDTGRTHSQVAISNSGYNNSTAFNS